MKFLPCNWKLQLVEKLGKTCILLVEMQKFFHQLITVILVFKLLQASFFTTYVLTSGWASLSCEAMQFLALFCNLVKRFVLRIKDDSSNCTFSFPYHTEVPRVLLFGFLGFTCSILAPLMLPFLLIYFSLAYLVYKNQVSALSCILPFMMLLAITVCICCLNVFSFS